jgi:hypothetical protein
VDGFYTGDPGKDEAARLMPLIERINGEIESMAGTSSSSVGTGGMLTKVQAAQKAGVAGVPTLIVNGRTERVLERVFAGEELGSLFLSSSSKLNARKRWIALSMRPSGRILLDEGAVRAVAEIRRPGPVAVPDLKAVARAFALALLLYGAVAAGFALLIGPKSAQALALGTILIFGVAYLVAQGLADAAPAELTKRTARASVAATLAYFTFQIIAGALWGANLPAPPVPGALEWALIVLALMSFGLVAVAQALFPLWAHHPASAGWRVHLANGLYLNTLLDRLIGGLRVTHTSNRT